MWSLLTALPGPADNARIAGASMLTPIPRTAVNLLGYNSPLLAALYNV
jgi:hypothetical protein